MISEERLVELHRWAFVGEYTTSSKYIMELVNGVRESLAEIRRLETENEYLLDALEKKVMEQRELLG